MNPLFPFEALVLIGPRSRRDSLALIQCRLRRYDKPLKGLEILLKSDQQDIVVVCRGNRKQLLSGCPEMLIQLLGLSEWDERIPFPVNQERREEDPPRALNARLIDLFHGNVVSREAHVPDDPDNTREPAVDDQASDAVLMPGCQLQGGDGPEGSPHDPQLASEPTFGQLRGHGLKQDMGIVNKAG